MKLYLAGPITGKPDYRESFAAWATFLAGKGHEVFNPAALGEGLPGWTDYLKRDIPRLVECDGLFAMPGWEGSQGSQLEVDLARRLEMPCFTEQDGQVVELVGRKFDGDKPRWDLLPWREVEQVVEVLTIGARKYNDHNWQRVEPPTRYVAAAFRHLIAWIKGERLDPETGVNHLAHAICCLLFLLWRDNEGETTKEEPMAPRKPKHDPCPKIIEIDRLLNGNGEKGALEKIDEHEKAIFQTASDHAKVEQHEAMLQQFAGSLKMLKAIFGTSILAVILSIVGLLLKVK